MAILDDYSIFAPPVFKRVPEYDKPWTCPHCGLPVTQALAWEAQRELSDSVIKGDVFHAPSTELEPEEHPAPCGFTCAGSLFMRRHGCYERPEVDTFDPESLDKLEQWSLGARLQRFAAPPERAGLQQMHFARGLGGCTRCEWVTCPMCAGKGHLELPRTLDNAWSPSRPPTCTRCNGQRRVAPDLEQYRIDNASTFG